MDGGEEDEILDEIREMRQEQLRRMMMEEPDEPRIDTMGFPALWFDRQIEQD